MKMTVFFDFDSGFWYGLIEYEDKQLGYQAFRYPFGQEPKDTKILEFIYKDLSPWMTRQEKLGVVSQSKLLEKPSSKNPKRMQREISKQFKKPALSSKAQEAIKASHELVKQQKKTLTRQQKKAYKERQFQLKQEKRRQKKKGH